MIVTNEQQEQINKRLQSDYDYLCSLGYNVIGVMLQGSQNYGLHYDGSDIDTKAIVIPSFNDFCIGKKMTSKTIVLDSNEHIDVKDIRLMHDCFRKSNINFLEILFTEFKLMNPVYQNVYQVMFDNANKIAHANTFAAINCMAGMVFEKHKALEHRYEGLVEKIDKFGYDPKQLHHIMRVYNLMERYMKGELFSDCLHEKQDKFLVSVKDTSSGSTLYTLEEARILADSFKTHTKLLKTHYFDNNKLVVDIETYEMMQQVVIDVFKLAFRNELGVQHGA